MSVPPAVGRAQGWLKADGSPSQLQWGQNSVPGGKLAALLGRELHVSSEAREVVVRDGDGGVLLRLGFSLSCAQTTSVEL